MKVKIELPDGTRYGRAARDMQIANADADELWGLALRGVDPLKLDVWLKILTNGVEKRIVALHTASLPAPTLVVEFVIQGWTTFVAFQRHHDRWVMAEHTLVVSQHSLSGLTGGEDHLKWRVIAPLVMVYLAEANGNGWFRREV